MSVACHVLPLDDPGIDPEGPWTLKVHVRHGVVRAKAWPAGKAEPKDWQVTRYTGSSGWEPRVLTVLPGAGEAAHVTRLAVRGSKPATALYLKSDEPGAAEKKQVVELAQQTTTLVEQAEFVKALEAARGCVEASKKAFGPDHAFTATCVNNLGGALHAAGKYDDALKAFEEGGAAGRRGAPPGPGRDGAARPGVRRGPAAAQLPGPDRVQPLEGALRPRAERRPADRPRGGRDGPVGHRPRGAGRV